MSTHEKGEPKFKTASGLETKTFYGPEDLAAGGWERDPGFPGQYPFTRGIHPTLYRSRLWTMRQYAGFGSAAESNARYRYLLSRGTTGLSVAFDLPTQIGLDSDHPLARGEVGRVGVAIDSLEDMELLFEGIPLDRVSTSMTINATAAILLALYFAVAEEQGADLAKLSGTVQNDILKEYIARGTYIYPPGPALRLVTDIFAFCRERAPEWNTISISGYHIREAGSTAIQEVAFTLANAIAYVEAARARGLAVDDFAPRLSFFLSAHNDLLEEVAKFRAARRLWARTMRERFKARDPRSWLFRFHTQTAGSTLAAQQPDVNIVRVTLQALAAVLGGTQSLHTNARDEALALPTEASALVALRTQQILAHETGIANTVDPLGGSYFVEKLTTEIEERAEEYIRKIDACGRPRRHRDRVRATGGPASRLRVPEGRGSREPDRRGRQPLRRGRGALAAHPAHRSRNRAFPGGTAAEAAPPPRRRARHRRVKASRSGRALRTQPDARDSRRRQGVRDRGRNLGRHAPSLW